MAISAPPATVLLWWESGSSVAKQVHTGPRSNVVSPKPGVLGMDKAAAPSQSGVGHRGVG